MPDIRASVSWCFGATLVVVALLLSAEKKIIAMQEGFAPQQVLPAGDASPFAISVHQVNGTPKSFRLYTSAMAAK